jgi:hypothetical protein
VSSKLKRLWECCCFCGCSTRIIITEDEILRIKTYYSSPNRPWSVSSSLAINRDYRKPIPGVGPYKPPACVSRVWKEILDSHQRLKKIQSRLNSKRRKQADRGWTRSMERALRDFQRVCIICGANERLVTDHVTPAVKRKGLRPGNAVRLCSQCNMRKYRATSGELPPMVAYCLRTAAMAFKAQWEKTQRQGAQAASLTSPRRASASERSRP